MYNKFFSWLSFVGLFAAFALQAVAQAPQPATPAPAGAAAPTGMMLGKIRATRVVGQVTYQAVGAPGAVQQPLANGAEISEGTIVRTGEASSVVLLFSNGASINLAFNSELNIAEFRQNPFEAQGNYEPGAATDEPSVSITNIKLERGELVGNVKKLKTTAGSRFTVGTPVGAAGIRGTTFRIVYRPSGNGQAFNFSLTTIEGNVELASGTVNLPVSVTNNQEVIINEVTVDPVTNAITVTTATGAVVTVTTPPPVTDAPVTLQQQVQAIANQLAQDVATVVFTPPTTQAPPTPPGGGTGGDGGTGGTGGTGTGGTGNGGTGTGGTTGETNNNTNSNNQQTQNQQTQNQQTQSQQTNSPSTSQPLPTITPGAGTP